LGQWPFSSPMEAAVEPHTLKKEAATKWRRLREPETVYGRIWNERSNSKISVRLGWPPA
jgi:hypothetical protein